MGQPGIGVMLHQLGGGAGAAEAWNKSVNQKIKSVKLGEDDALHFEFHNGYKMKIYDAGQSCCESRYMRTDDKLGKFRGAILLDALIKDAPPVTGEYGDEHEVQFLEVVTDKGSFVMSSHNEHNGYYGGFAIHVVEE